MKDFGEERELLQDYRNNAWIRVAKASEGLSFDFRAWLEAIILAVTWTLVAEDQGPSSGSERTKYRSPTLRWNQVRAIMAK